MIATIFRSRLNPGGEAEYGPMAKQMRELVRTIPGYVSHKGWLWAEKPLRLKSIFTSAVNLICPVQSSREKYSASVVGQISGLNRRVSPE